MGIFLLKTVVGYQKFTSCPMFCPFPPGLLHTPVAQGFTYRETGDQLHISEHTVRYHVEQIKKKLNVSKRVEVVARAIQLGLVEAPQE